MVDAQLHLAGVTEATKLEKSKTDRVQFKKQEGESDDDTNPTKKKSKDEKGSGGTRNVPNPVAEMEFTEYALSSRCVAWRCSKQTLARETALARFVPGIERVLARFCRLNASSDDLGWLCAPQDRVLSALSPRSRGGAYSSPRVALGKKRRVEHQVL